MKHYPEKYGFHWEAIYQAIEILESVQENCTSDLLRDIAAVNPVEAERARSVSQAIERFLARIKELEEEE